MLTSVGGNELNQSVASSVKSKKKSICESLESTQNFAQVMKYFSHFSALSASVFSPLNALGARAESFKVTDDRIYIIAVFSSSWSKIRSMNDFPTTVQKLLL